MIMGNYRPISLLPAISKVLEKVVYSQLQIYFTSNNLLYKGQYGFPEDHSTEMANIEHRQNNYGSRRQKAAHIHLYGSVESIRHPKSRNPFVQTTISWNIGCCPWLVQ